MAAAGQFSWPPAGSYLAVSGQFLVAVVTGGIHNKISAGAPAGWLIGIDRDAETRAALRTGLQATGVLLPSACPSCLAGAQAERDALRRLPGLAGDISGLPGILCAGHLSDAAATASPGGRRELLAWQVQCMASRSRTGSAHRIRTRLRRKEMGVARLE
jgi:hypothetical protein